MQTQSFPQTPWRPLTDLEFRVLAIQLPGAGRTRRGRPHKNLRRTLDAIFWVAAGRARWRDLPPDLGSGTSAHRMLCRWADAGVIPHLLKALVNPNLPCLKPIAYWVCRACRRMTRRLPDETLRLVRRMGLVDAWPHKVIRLKDPNLSMAAKKQATEAFSHLPTVWKSVEQEAHNRPNTQLHDAICPKLLRLAMRTHALAAQWARLWYRAGTSNRYAWRLK